MIKSFHFRLIIKNHETVVEHVVVMLELNAKPRIFDKSRIDIILRLIVSNNRNRYSAFGRLEKLKRFDINVIVNNDN